MSIDVTIGGREAARRVRVARRARARRLLRPPLVHRPARTAQSFDVTHNELETSLREGMSIDGSSMRGFNAIQDSDMVALADPATFCVLPAPDEDVARMFADIARPNGTPFEADGRELLRRALRRMESMGFDTFNVGPELEFFLFRMEDGRPVPVDGGDYYTAPAQDAAGRLRKEIVRTLEEMGIPVEYSHHEVGPAQQEISIRFSDALSTADNAVTYRSVVKEVAGRHDLHATFMPKPIGENGSGMHTHQSLFSGGENAFFDESDPWFLSGVAKSFVAGQLRHAREIAVGLAQWANSYKRLVPGYEAPVYTAWARGNRSALIRLPHYQPGANAPRGSRSAARTRPATPTSPSPCSCTPG